VTYYACVVAAYTAAAYSPYRLPTMISVVALGLLAWQSTRNGMPTIPQQYVGSGVLAMVVLAGLALWLWRSRFEEGQLRLVAAERERAAELRQAIESERSRIARELHDVVTHNVSVMVIQAGAARRTLPTSPDEAREALLAVEGAGRTAMAELRHVMGLLSSSDIEDADLTPQPGLGDLETLVARVRDAAGMPVELTILGTPRPVPAGKSLAAYRVVQEGLTNAVKHAPGGSATVTVQYDDQMLSVEVENTGTHGPGPPWHGSGRGLLGLRERLAVYGGLLSAGRLPTGFRISAVLPLEPP
jgi:signal transduction histidine kinase